MKKQLKLLALYCLVLFTPSSFAVAINFNDGLHDGQSSFSILSGGLTYTFQNPSSTDTTFTVDSNQLLFGLFNGGNSPVNMNQFELVVSGGDGLLAGYGTSTETNGADAFSITGSNTNNGYNNLDGSTASASVVFTTPLTLLENQIYTFTYDITFANPTAQGVTGFGSFDVSPATPSAVPIPAAVWLFGSALMGLVGLRKRKS